MTLDLSQLQIPDVSVVPEPTQADFESLPGWLKDDCTVDRLMAFLARRCRVLEADLQTTNDLVAAKERTAEEYRHTSASNLLHIDRELKPRIADLEERDRQAAEAYAAKCETQRYLEAEVERLRTRKCVHDLAREGGD